MKYKALAKQEMKKELKEISNLMSSAESRAPVKPTSRKYYGSTQRAMTDQVQQKSYDRLNRQVDIRERRCIRRCIAGPREKL